MVKPELQEHVDEPIVDPETHWQVVETNLLRGSREAQVTHLLELPETAESVEQEATQKVPFRLRYPGVQEVGETH